MSGKGPVSGMSDECLISWKQCFLFYIDCQAVTRKFTLARKTMWIIHKLNKRYVSYMVQSPNIVYCHM